MIRSFLNFGERHVMEYTISKNTLFLRMDFIIRRAWFLLNEPGAENRVVRNSLLLFYPNTSIPRASKFHSGCLAMSSWLLPLPGHIALLLIYHPLWCEFQLKDSIG